MINCRFRSNMRRGIFSKRWIYSLVLILFCLNFYTDGVFASYRCPTREEKTARACEHATLIMKCESGVIRISRAVYGRFSLDICNERLQIEGLNTQCMAFNSTRIVTERCDGNKECKVGAVNKVFGDPCVNTPKYLQADYCCQEIQEPETDAPTTTTSTTTRTTRKTTTSVATVKSTAEPTTREKLTETDSPSTTQRQTSPPPTKSTQRFCPRVRRNGLWWPRTRAGEEVSLPCQGNKEGRITWKCGPRGWSGSPDTTGCVSQWVSNIEDKIKESADVAEAVEELSQQTASNHMGAGDLKKTAKNIFPKLNQVLRTQLNSSTSQGKRETIDRFSRAIVHTGSNLLSEKQSESWRKLPSADRSAVATSITVNMEETGFEIAANLAIDEKVIAQDENILLEVSVVSVTNDSQSDVKFPSVPAASWDEEYEKVSIPMENFRSRSDKGRVTVVFLVYQNLGEWMNPEGQQPLSESEASIATVMYSPGEAKAIAMETQKQPFINTNIFSASINNKKQRVHLQKPFTFTMKHKEPPKDSEKPLCSYWDFNESVAGHWSSEGCSVVDSNDISTTCRCNHLTNFAVLMDVHGTKLSEEHEIALMAITYIGCIISIVCLFCSLFTFSFFKNLQCDRNTIHKNLVLCLMLAEIVFIIGISLTQNKIVCGVVAGLLHFLFLASFSWMCLEGVQLYIMLIEVFEAERSRRKWYYLMGYGVPTVIVAVSAGLKYTDYGTDRYCWLRTDTSFIWSFVGPVIAVIFVNIIMLSIAVYMMCKHANTLASSLRTMEKSRQQKASKDPYSGSSSGSTSYMLEEKKRSLVEIPAWIKGAVVLVVLLGLTWVFGFMYVNEESVVMAYVFTGLNTLQGLFIFVFHCLMNEKVKKEYKKLAYRSTWLPSCFRNICVGYSGSMSHSPNNSSSSGGHLLKFWSGRRRKSSSSTLEKGQKGKGKNRRSDPRSDSEFFTSTGKDTNSVFSHGSHRNSSKSNGHTNGNYPHVYHGIDGMVGDLSVVDCSVIDTEYVSEYCQNQMQVSMEKRRYSSGSEDANMNDEDIMENKNRLSVLSDDSAIKNNSDFASSEADAGDLSYSDISEDEDEEDKIFRAQSESEIELLMPRSESERNLLNNMQDKSNFDADGKKCYPGSINEIYLYQNYLSSGEELNHSTPCIKFKQSPPRPLHSEDEDTSSDPMLCSLPQLRIVEDIDLLIDQSNHMSHSMDLDPTSQRKKLNKLKSDKQKENDYQNYDLDYSEC